MMGDGDDIEEADQKMRKTPGFFRRFRGQCPPSTTTGRVRSQDEFLDRRSLRRHGMR